MEHIMSQEEKGIEVVTVTHLKDSCNSVLNLQPPAAGKHPTLMLINAGVVLTAS